MVEYQCSDCKENMIEQANGYLCPRCGLLDQFGEEVWDESDSLCLDGGRQRTKISVPKADRSAVRRGKRRAGQGASASSSIFYGENKTSGGRSPWKC